VEAGPAGHQSPVQCLPVWTSAALLTTGSHRAHISGAHTWRMRLPVQGEEAQFALLLKRGLEEQGDVAEGRGAAAGPGARARSAAASAGQTWRPSAVVGSSRQGGAWT